MASFDVILTDKAPIPSSGYSQGIRWDKLVVTAGYLGTHPDGSGVVKGGFEAEVRQALSNIKAVLEEAGCTMADVIRINVSLTDISRFADMDRVYREFFQRPTQPATRLALKSYGAARRWGLMCGP